MTISQMHTAFRFGMDKMDGLNYPNFLPEEIDLLLNQAQYRFTKQRYGISNPKKTSFEETQKRAEDLKELIRNVVIVPTANSGIVNVGQNITTNSVFCDLPSDHWFIIWERCIINSSRCTTESITIRTPDTYVLQCRDCPTCDLDTCTADNIITVTVPGTNIIVEGRYVEVRPVQHLELDKVLEDAFKAPDYTKVLRVMYENKAEIIPATYTTVVRYLMRYIKKPATMSVTTPVVSCELSEHTHQEIVDTAIVIALEGIEAKRNNTFTQLIDNTKE